MPAPDRIKQLVETFEKNINDYRFNKNETELRRQFLDPFFEALGWDVDNKQGKDERHKEVAHEFSVEIDGQQKKADYAFRTEKDIFDFLVEAKKPSVKVESNADAAFQIRSYGWSAKLPINILTDFEHFAIYDCRIRPNYAKDDAKTGRIAIFDYKEYITRWDEIANLFSPDAIRNGALNEYSNGLKSKKGTQEVDDAFLEEIEGWREALAKNIASRNKDKNLNEVQINFAVQMTIDRIIFLRIAEERGMEKDRKLFELIENTNIYKDLLKFFAQADERYNSGLFHFKKDKERENPDTLSAQLNIDDKVLKDIIKDLYYPSPYAFTYIPTEILGSVYERFLGKVIRLTAGGNAKVEEKPEVRKAGGVYYTPSYIVEYIVKNTVGKLVEEKTPDDVSKIKIVDPACGSGSFLLGAYQFLLDWHLDWYVSNQPEKWVKNKTILTADNKTYRLSIDEKKRILLNNIHGVDLDPQAVEVTKLSLLLKVVEDPGQLKMFEEGHILPNLNKNIKNGNALIGTDYFSGQMFGDMEEMKRVKPFDWQSEFPEVFKRGGFDAVIGNPPYVRQEILGEQFKLYAKDHYKTFASTADLYTYFIEKSHILLKAGGRFGMICSNKFMRSNYGKALRDFIASNSQIAQIVDFGELPVFENAATFPVILLTIQNKPSKQEFDYARIKRLDFSSLFEEVKSMNLRLTENSISGGEWTLLEEKDFLVFEKIKNIGIPLGDYTNKGVYFGIKTGFNAGFIISKELRDSIISKEPKSAEHIKPFVFGDDVRKYQINFKHEYLIRIPKGWTNTQKPKSLNAWEWFSKKHPVISQHLLQFKDDAEKRQDQGDYWWELRACDYYDKMEIPKIVYPDIAKESRVAFDKDGLYFSNTVYFIPRDDLYLLGILNSKLIFNYFKSIASVLGDPDKGGRLRWFRQDVMRLPIRAINFNDPAEKSKHDKMVSLVEQMLALHKSLAEAKTPQEGELIQRQITSTDKAIDSLVYELYGLSPAEIEIVEGKE